jgi:DNA polymerase
MDLIGLDFESFYSTEYSLSRMSTEAYIRDPRFYCQMIGIKINDAPTKAYHPDVLYDPKLRALIERSACVAFHAHFDGAILNWKYGLRPAFWFDPLPMSRMLYPHNKGHSLAALAKYLGLPDKMTQTLYDIKGIRDLTKEQWDRLAVYNVNDVELMMSMLRIMLPQTPRDELRIIDLVTRMFTEPKLVLDQPAAATFLQELRTRKASQLATLGIRAEDLASSARFSVLLGQLGVETPMKPSPTNPTKPCPSCAERGVVSADCMDCEGTSVVENLIPALAKSDDGMKALLDDPDERVQLLAAARLGVKSTINETRAESMLACAARGTRGTMPVYLKVAGAHTLRMSGGDGNNYQNLTPELKKILLAPRGYKILTVDAAQIECRGLNFIAGQWDVLDKFRRGDDVYSENAMRFYGYEVSKKNPNTSKERHLGKTMELGAGFGVGWSTFQATLKKGALGGPSIIISDDEAKLAIKLYREGHPRVTALWKQAGEVLQYLATGVSMKWGILEIADSRIYLPNGAFLDYAGLTREGHEWFCDFGRGKEKIYGSLLVENVIQALFSGLLIRECMLRIAARYPVVLQVHDDISFLAPVAEEEAAKAFAYTEMTWLPAWVDERLPLDAEVVSGDRYSH